MEPVPPARIVFPPDDVERIKDQIGEILRTGRLTLGRYTEEFEKEFAERHGRRHGIAVNSGTSAVEIILRAMRIRSRRVVVPTNTFAATAFGVQHAGNDVVLAEADEDLFIDVSDVRNLLTEDVGAVVPVHIGGRVVPQMQELAEACEEKGIPLIEDAAHAHGSRNGDRYAGGFGVAAAFSFYPTKVMTSGEGGMIVTDDEEIAATARVLRDQGKAGFGRNVHTELGYNWRMSEIHACIGLAQLSRLKEFIEARRRVASVYDGVLSDAHNVRVLKESEGMRSNYYKYIAVLPPGVQRAKVKGVLKERYGVSLSGEVYEVPLHAQPVFEKLATRAFPTAEDLCARHICLPVFVGMADGQARRVVEGLLEVVP